MRPRERLQTSGLAANREARVSGQVRSEVVVEAGKTARRSTSFGVDQKGRHFVATRWRNSKGKR